MLALSRAWILSLALCQSDAHAGPRQSFSFAEQAPRADERLRERWQGRPREERERLERNLEELERLPTETRRKLLERARVLRERERSLEREMPQELHDRMRDLGPERGGELWRQHLHKRFRELGRELRERLPMGFRRPLEEARPEVRRRMLERTLQERQRMGLSMREVQRLQRLPRPDRVRELRELERRAEHGSRERALSRR